VKVSRREALQAAGAALIAPVPGAGQRVFGPAPERAVWTAYLRRVADPVLSHLASDTLRARMPVEQHAGGNRQQVTHLEAFGRVLSGLAPSLEAEPTSAYAELARKALRVAVDPSARDFLNFSQGSQPLVDAAFLAQGLLRAPAALLGSIDAPTTRNLVAALESTRTITPGFSNWLLFMAMVEAGLAKLGAKWDRARVEYAVRQHDQWYKGDGAYGDGPVFHWDYYNSFVIHPMLVDVAAALADKVPVLKELSPRIDERARRYAAVQERLIGPDGTFPPIGRSLAYRCGAFHLLAQSALRRALPEGVSPAQVRGALGAVIKRTLDAPETFDTDGWLRIGFCGHQAGVGETYISTGSLYLCSAAFLPLGLSPDDPFWVDPPAPFTQQRAWGGQPFPIDHALA
jgi:hypothetical protein